MSDPGMNIKIAALGHLRMARAAMIQARDDWRKGTRELAVALTDANRKYWWRASPDAEPEIMSVLAYADGSPMIHCNYGEWSSTPIAEPKGGNDAVDR